MERVPSKKTHHRARNKIPSNGVDNDNGDGGDDRKLDHRLPSAMSRFMRQTNPILWELDLTSKHKKRNLYT